MRAATYALEIDGELLQRGFWLYVWEIAPPRGSRLYYVGRTGDSSSSNAQSPFNRMGQHLGFNEKSNVLRRHLRAKGIDPAKCSFRLVAHGPILEEAPSQQQHRPSRDRVAALEKALADLMSAAGYDVMNKVKSSKPLDTKQFAEIRAAFAAHFPRLSIEGD